MRSEPGSYPEYHTSFDNKDIVSMDRLQRAADLAFDFVQALESNEVWENTVLYCEPALSRRGLYPTLSSPEARSDRTKAMFALLNSADGTRDLLSIAKESGKPLKLLISAAEELAPKGLLKKVCASAP